MNLVLILKATFRLRPGSACEQDQELHDICGDLLSEFEGRETVKYPSDFVPFKPRTDVLYVGTAHSPSGQHTTELNASVRVGTFNKTICVVGDRVWKRRFLFWARPSAPAPFKAVPVLYQRAFGGANWKRNPVGLGYDMERLPNIESLSDRVRKRSDRPVPAGFGPIASRWEPRRSKVGSYKGRWSKERWPWFPDDFDWSYFNAAPEDQQMEGYLRGDEELELRNLHPQHPIYRGQLPGLRTRAFVQVELPDSQPEFREVKMNLDTLWIDMDSEKLVLLWRGLTPVRTVKYKEVTHLAALTEPLTAPLRSKEEMQEWMHQRIREERGEVRPSPEEAAEEAADKESQEAFEKDMAAMDKEEAELEKEFAGAEEDAEKQLESEKADLIAAGIDPETLQQPPQAQTVAEMKAQLASEVARLSETSPEAAAKLASVGKELGELEAVEQEFAALEAEDAPSPSPESVQAAVAQGKPLTGADLSGLDFSNKDLTGADFSDADFSNANLANAKLARCKLDGVNFSEANLAGADFTQAILDGADFSESKLQGARFSGASIEGTSFSKLQLPDADFSDCKGRHSNFSSSNLEGANFARAKLFQADFCRANVKGANFSEAELASADFGGASAAGINMEKADLTNLRAGEKADFTGGKFREAKAPKSIWEGSICDRADFSRAVLVGALFEDASVKDARFDRADLTKASFEDASAQRAVMTNANLLRASFDRANLTEARLDGSNLYEAAFWETIFGNTTAEGANLKRTMLA